MTPRRIPEGVSGLANRGVSWHVLRRDVDGEMDPADPRRVPLMGGGAQILPAPDESDSTVDESH